MCKRGLAGIIFVIALIPSAQFAWQNRDMPEFADLHDDGILFVSAQSLAHGDGYRIASLPERPYQTKYPPLYPFFLSLIWRLSPAFPQNLALATMFCWLTLVACLWLALTLYKDEPCLKQYQWWMLGLLGLCPYMVLFGARMFSEILFTCFTLAALLSLRRAQTESGFRWIALGALLAAAAYLTRTAGLALVASSVLLMAWRRQWRSAAAFVSISCPVIVAWMAWTRLHLPHTTDLSLMYYVDYMGFQRINVGWDNLSVVLWKNLDQILYAMGSLALPKIIDLLPVKILAQVIAIAMISGVIRLVRKGALREYALFGLFSCVILAVWHYPPNERFLLPLYPLLLAGLFVEMQHLWQMLSATFRRPQWSERTVALGFGAATVCLLGVALGLQCFVTFHLMPESTRQKRVKLAQRREAYSWMAANLPPEAAVYSYDDPLLYLYTGHRGIYNPMLPRYWYGEDHANIVNPYRHCADFCQKHGLTYFYFTTEDGLRETGEDDRKAMEAAIRKDPNLEPLHASGIGTVFRVKGAETSITAAR